MPTKQNSVREYSPNTKKIGRISAIYVNKKFVKGYMDIMGYFHGDDGHAYVRELSTGRWVAEKDSFKSELSKAKVPASALLNEIVTIDDKSYQYRDDDGDGELELVLVDIAKRVTSLGYVKNAGVKSRAPGS